MLRRSLICPRPSPAQFSETPSFSKQSSVESDSTITLKVKENINCKDNYVLDVT